MTSPRYVCGHSPDELARLGVQNTLFEDITHSMFAAANLRRGSRVLDIGCGAGDLTLLVAEIVGPHGSVVGVDRAADAIAVASQRRPGPSAGSVEFRIGAIDDLADGPPFDALVGRFVLMHQTDPAATLRAAARHVRPGGLIVMLESVLCACVAGFHSVPHSPAYDRALRFLIAIIQAAGADIEMGLRLPRVFEDAGLGRPITSMQARIESGPDAAIYGYISNSIRSVLPLAHELGISSDGVDPLRLEQELRAEAMASDGVLVSPPVVAAWTTTSGSAGRLESKATSQSSRRG